MIMSLGNDSNNKLELTTGSTTTLSLINSGSANSVSSSNALSTVDFSHIVGIISDNSMSLYIDNTLIGSTTVDQYIPNTFFTKNYLGCDLSNQNIFNGTIAYFKTWLDYSILLSELSNLYDNRIEPEPEPEPEENAITELERYWDFRQNPSTLLVNSNNERLIPDGVSNDNNYEATLNNIVDSNIDFTGITLDGSTSYVNIGRGGLSLTDGSYSLIQDGDYDVYVFDDVTTAHNISVNSDTTVEYLIVAGGGASSTSGTASGAGAGGMQQGFIDLSANVGYKIRVGDGGTKFAHNTNITWMDYETNQSVTAGFSFAGNTNNNNNYHVTDVNFWNGVKGKDSYIKIASNEGSIYDASGIEVKAYGGGVGFDQSTSWHSHSSGMQTTLSVNLIQAAHDGGSSGGGDRYIHAAGELLGTNQGNKGGNGQGSGANGSATGCGGGGGAGGEGTGYSGSGVQSGVAAGGIGKASSITGTSITYAQGGDGAAASSNVKGGGQTVNGQADGVNGTGGGGAGGNVGGSGGSGVVILRMLRGAGSFSINVVGDSSPGNGFCFETNVLYQENNITFNKFKVSKASGWVNLNELQIWIKDDVTNIKNIAPEFTTIASSDSNNQGLTNRDPDHLINENVNAVAEGTWHSTTSSGVYASFTASSSYNMSDIQSIVLYDRLDGSDAGRIVNVKIELFKDDKLCIVIQLWMMKDILG